MRKVETLSREVLFFLVGTVLVALTIRADAQTAKMELDADLAVSGNVRVGAEDDADVKLKISGAPDGGNAEGGEMQLETPGDWDWAYEFWRLDVYQDELRIGPEGVVGLRFTTNCDAYVPAAMIIYSIDDMVTNGDFNSSEGWILGRWSIQSGNASITSGDASALEQDVGGETGKQYRVVYTISSISGTLQVEIGGQTGSQRTSTGTWSEEITATGSGNLKIHALVNAAATIDDVQVYEMPSSDSRKAKLFTAGDELVVVDGIGNVTTLSSHNIGPVVLSPDDGAPFTIHHRNVFTGKEQWIYLSRLAQLVQQLTGEQLIWEQDSEPYDVEAWQLQQQEKRMEETKQAKGMLLGVAPADVILDATPSKPQLPQWVIDRIPADDN